MHLAARQQTADAPAPDLIRDLHERLACEIAAIQQAEALAMQSAARWRETSVRSRIDVEHSAIQRTIHDIAEWTVTECERLLSKPGAPARCDAKEWLQNRFSDNKVETYLSFSPVELWDYLSAAYAPDRIVDEARRRAAKQIYSTFQLWRSEDIKRVTGRVVITMQISSEKHYNRPQRRYSYYAESQLTGFSQAIDVFVAAQAIDTGRYDLIAMVRFLERALRYDFEFASGDRYDFSGGITATCFNTGIKIHLPDPVANELNAFLALYRQED